MPPTVMTPWFTRGCWLCVVLVGPAAAEPLPPELVCAPELVFPAEAVWPPDAAPLLATCVPDVLPLLGGVRVPDVAPLLGVPVPEPLAVVVYACPATAAVAGCTVVAPPRCAKSYAMAPPRTRVA